MKVHWLLGLGILLGIVGASLFVALSVLYLKPYLRVRSMERTECVTVNSTYGRTDETSTCECSATRKCISSYPCVQVTVNYTTKDKYFVSNATLYETQETFYLQRNAQQCSFHSCYYKIEKNDKTIKKLSEQYSTPGTATPCFYEPSDLSYVIVQIIPLTKVIHALFWPLLALVIGLVIITAQICDVCQIAKTSSSTASPFNSLEKPWLRHAERNYEKVKTLAEYQREEDDELGAHENQ